MGRAVFLFPKRMLSKFNHPINIWDLTATTQEKEKVDDDGKENIEIRNIL